MEGTRRRIAPRGVITGILLALGLTGISTAFLKTATPYGNFADARKRAPDEIYVAGNIDKSSINSNLRENKVTFKLTDDKGEKSEVVYTGPPPANMGEATRVVAIGTFKGDTFAASNLRLKCPSKYESEKKGSSVRTN